MIEIKSLSGAILARVDATTLSGASLSWADLRGANLSWADLRGADLSDADLSRAYLSRAHLSRAHLSGYYMIDAGQDVRGYRFVAVPHDSGLRIAAGCRWFTLHEALAHWKQAHDDDPALRSECLGKVKHIRRVAKARGWAL